MGTARDWSPSWGTEHPTSFSQSLKHIHTYKLNQKIICMSVQLIARLSNLQLERVQTSLLVVQHISLHNIQVLARMLVDRQELTTNKE